MIESNLVPITDIMTRHVTCAPRDMHVDELTKRMIRDHIGCIPVVDEAGRPIGMVTKLDLVEASGREDLAFRTATDVMMPLAMTLGDHATVAHAAKLMASEDVHHVPVVDRERRLVGIVSTLDVVRWLASVPE